MIEQILERFRASTWDFRSVAFPDDQPANQPERWVEQFRLKAAIAEVLRPASILEIGVRSGYAYAAFKHGYPRTCYLGLDARAGASEDERRALRTAWKRLAAADDKLLAGDSWKRDRLPGALYDLIHVNGGEGGGSAYHDLSLALAQGRHVLVDGYFWTRDHCLSVSDFLLRHRDAVEYALMIPGYAGELLIKVDAAHLARETRRLRGESGGGGSEPLRESYTADYYLKDCGGWEAFERHRGRRLDNLRLQSLLDLALLNRPRRLLDLGCGRGEITYQAARQGVEVTAVDYSPAAIEIARTCFADEPALGERVGWICGSAADLTLQGEYDTVVAGDLVEHLSPAELDRMYATVARHLAPGGRLVVHTFPNAWFYRYHYARQRRVAAGVGAYLPAEPRSRYEKLMHINEQSPRVLRRQLRRHFPEVRLWFLHPEEPAGSLARPMGRRELAACRDLYAVASTSPIDPADLRRVLEMHPLSDKQARCVSWSVAACPAEARAGASFAVTVAIHNGSGATIHSRKPCPVNLCYHWRDAAGGAMEVFDGQRSPLSPALADGRTAAFEATVMAPARAGAFSLEMTLVQEGVRWFEAGRPEPPATRRLDILPANP